MKIGIASGSSFAVAGLYRSWDVPGEMPSFSFTQLTVNAGTHPLMRRMHKLGDEKRSLVILAKDKYGNWLSCRNGEEVKTLLTLLPEDFMSFSSVGKYGR